VLGVAPKFFATVTGQLAAEIITGYALDFVCLIEDDG
jgi:hypothetical protein